MSIKVIRYRLPSYWACPLINDDYTGLTDEECEEIHKIQDMERLNFETLFRIVRWDYNRCFKDESLDKDLFVEKYGRVMGEHYYNKFVHEFDGNILKMVGYFRGSEKEGEKVWVEFIESEFGKPKEILRSFDFTVTKMAYYKEPKYEEKEDDYFPFSSASIVAYEYKLLYHEKFFEHLHMKRLVIDENIPFPVSTWERSYRYKGYGYNMCRETKKKLLQAIKGVNVEEEDVSLYTTGGWD